jgi:hypothetical protein
MLEKDIENLLANYPDELFPGEGFKLINQQFTIEGRRIDILFEDKHGRQIIVEVKRGILSREASGQIAEYYGLLKNADETKNYELILCANIIPKERKVFLETIGIDCKELGIAQISQIANKHGYTFLDDSSTFKNIDEANQHSRRDKVNRVIKHKEKTADTVDTNQEISVWLFQGNPKIYDILNALSDLEIGNTIHWTVNQNKNRIHKGHLALIWMSGKEAGIYALGRIETDPLIMDETEEEKKYWLDSEPVSNGLMVRISIIRRLINKPVLRTEIKEIPELSSLSILKQPTGTNFPVNDNEWEIIAGLI